MNLGELMDGEPNRVALIDLSNGAQYTYAHLEKLIYNANVTV